MTSGRGRANSADAAWPLLLAAVLLCGIATIILLVAPVVLGQLIAQHNFSLSQAGYVIAAELAGISLASLPALWWMRRIGWRRAAYIAIFLMTAGNITSMWVASFPALMLLRLTTALAAGSVVVLSMAIIGRTANPDRQFGFWVVGQLVTGAAALMVLPRLFAVAGLEVFYAAVALTTLALLPLVRHFPMVVDDAASPAQQSLFVALRAAPAAGLGVIGIFSFYITISGVWTYVERIGHGAGYAASFIGTVLAVATIMGIVGAVAATAIADRGGRSRMIGLGFALLLLSISMLLGAYDTALYVSAVLIFKFTWTFALPFMLASITAFDPTGKLIVLTNMAMGGGLAVGPALAGWLLGAGHSYNAILLMLSAVTALSATIMVYTSVKTTTQFK